jgi:two-component sensor histidine kinase
MAREAYMNETDVSALMNEVGHRVKNNMQVLQSLLGASMREASIPEAREALAAAAQRVGAMAAAQNSLYCINATSFETRTLLEALVRNACQGFGRKVDIAIEAASGVLANDAAVPLALIVNELISNAIKHGRGERAHVSVRIRLISQGEEWVLEIADDGPGFTMVQPQKRASGLGLVILLARQLGGTLEVIEDRGARCVVRFGGPRSGR